jgi:hypothetical protein
LPHPFLYQQPVLNYIAIFLFRTSVNLFVFVSVRVSICIFAFVSVFVSVTIVLVCRAIVLVSLVLALLYRVDDFGLTIVGCRRGVCIWTCRWQDLIVLRVRLQAQPVFDFGQSGLDASKRLLGTADDLVVAEVVYTPALAADYRGLLPDDGAVLGHRIDDNCCRAYDRSASDGDGAQHLGMGTDGHVVAQRRVALASLLAGATQGHALQQRAAVTDLSGLSDDGACTVVYEKAPADTGAGMDFHSSEKLGYLRVEARCQAKTRPPQSVVYAMCYGGMQS